MTTQEEYDVLRQGILSNVSEVVKWEERIVRQIMKDLKVPVYDLVRRVRQYVRLGGILEQYPEDRPNWRDDYRSKHWVILPASNLPAQVATLFPNGYFVEFRIDNPGREELEETSLDKIDEDDVIIKLVSGHDQKDWR